jgi:hypothetical protein
MTHRPVGLNTSFVTGAVAAKSTAFSVQSNTLRVTATGADTFVAIGTEPTATHSDYVIVSGSSATLGLTLASQRVVGIQTGSTTTITLPEGTGSPFEVGDYVTLTTDAQTYYQFTHCPVTSVINTSSISGAFSTKIGIGTNTTGIVTAFTSTGNIRKSLRLSAMTTGSAGRVHLQQVQISGDA